MYTQHTVYIQLVGRSSVHIHIQYTVRVYTVQCIHIYTVYTHTYVCVCVYPHTVHCTCIYITVYIYIHFIYTDEQYTISGGIYDSFDGTKGSFDRM